MLSAAHRDMLEVESSVTPGVIGARGYFTAEKAEQLAAIGFSKTQAALVPSLVIPIHGVDGEIVLYQSRPDQPRKNGDGKLVKYETAAGARMRIDVPPESLKSLDNPSVPLWITEGAKKADSAASRGLCCIALIGVWNWRGANDKGGILELADWEAVAIKGRVCYVAFDSDVMVKAPVKMALRRLAAFLKRRGAKAVRPVVIQSPKKGKTGLDDFFACGGTLTQLESSVDDSILADSSIIVNNRSLADVAAEGLAAVRAANIPPSVFVRAGALCRVECDERGQSKIRQFGQSAFRGHLARCAAWVTLGAKGSTEVAPPKDVVDDILSLGSWPDIPPLITITRAPVLAMDGSLSMAPGYCDKAQVYIAARDEWPEFEGSASDAANWIFDEVLADFPFAGDADRAHALALMLLPVVRQAIQGPTPLHLIDAPVPGSGKTLLGKICLLPAIGGAISTTPTATRDEDEMRKQITSSLFGGASYIFLDNLSRRIDSQNLTQALTSPEWEARVLGSSQNVVLPVRVIWLATTNNAEISRDIIRRTIHIRLDSKCEQPELRSGFKKSNIEGWVSENRPKIVAALCHIVRNWVGAGRPLFDRIAMGSFEDWCAVMGGIIESAGVMGFLSNAKDLRDAASDGGEAGWAAFYGGWAIRFGDQPVKAAELIEEFKTVDALAGMLGDKAESSQRIRLGNLLKKRRGVIAAGFHIEPFDTHQGTVRYRLSGAAPTPVDQSGLFGSAEETSQQEDEGEEITL